MAGLFDWFQNLSNPLAVPTADPETEARRKYWAGEITLEEYWDFHNRLAGIEKKYEGKVEEIKKDVAAEYSYGNVYGEPIKAAAGAVAGQLGNVWIIALVVVGLIVYREISR